MMERSRRLVPGRGRTAQKTRQRLRHGRLLCQAICARPVPFALRCLAVVPMARKRRQAPSVRGKPSLRSSVANLLRCIPLATHTCAILLCWSVRPEERARPTASYFSVAVEQRQTDVDSPLPPASTSDSQQTDIPSPALPRHGTGVGADGGRAKQAAVVGSRGKARNPSARSTSGQAQYPAIGAPLVVSCETHTHTHTHTLTHTHTHTQIEGRRRIRKGFRQCVLRHMRGEW